jgi:hypothetical protein
VTNWLDVPYYHNPYQFFITSYTRPACHVGWQATTSGPEARVVGAVVGELLAMGFSGSDIRLEYHIDPRNRVDVAVLDDHRPLLVECKAVCITHAAVRQGQRYLAAARFRWPDKDPLMVLAAPDRRPDLVEEDGLVIVRVPAA